jgi:hypothetical protein
MEVEGEEKHSLLFNMNSPKKKLLKLSIEN